MNSLGPPENVHNSHLAFACPAELHWKVIQQHVRREEIHAGCHRRFVPSFWYGWIFRKTPMRAWHVLSVIAVLQLAGGSASAQRSSTERALPSRQLLSRYGLELAWWGQGVLNPARDTVEHLTADEDCVFVQSTSGIVTAFDALTGQKRWAVLLGQYDPPSFPVVTNEDMALVVVGTRMYSVDKLSGKTLWELRLPGQPTTAPAADEHHVYVGMLDGSLYAFDLKKIHKLFRQGLLPEWSYQTVAWRYATAKEISSPPLIFNSRICMASRDGNVYAVSTDYRKLVFQFETDAPIVAPIARAGDLLYVASEDYSFYALRVRATEAFKAKDQAAGSIFVEQSMRKDTASGKVVWEFTSGRPIRKAPFPIGTDIFLMPDRGGMVCLDAKAGFQKWPNAQLQAENFVAATSRTVYATDRERNLMLLSRSTGDIQGSLPMQRFSVRFGNNRTDRIVLSTDSGLVVVLRETGKVIPTFHMYPDRLPIVPDFASEDGDGPAEGEMPTNEEGEMPAGEEAAPEAATEE